MDEFKVTFYPDEKAIKVRKDDILLAAAAAAGVYINNVCGGEGLCGKCRVIIQKGEVSTQPTSLLTRKEIQRGYVLACEAKIESDLEVEIPPESRLGGEQILLEGKRLAALYGPITEFESTEQLELEERKVFTHSPLATKICLQLPPPTLEDNVSDLERLYREIRRGRGEIPIMQTGLVNIKRLGALLRENDWKITAILGKRGGTVEVVQLEPGDTSAENYGIAVDVGTTTVVATLLDLNNGNTLGTKGTYNKQMTYGADIISRIIYAGEKDGLDRLHKAVVENVNSLIAALISEHQLKLSSVNGVLCAGNSTMVHLLLGVDPTYLRREPYVPSANFVPVIRAAEAGIKINARGLLASLPGVSSYVGGDISAGVLACGLAASDKTTLFIDMGTNGEIVLGNKDWMVCCACSIGPAFEGCGIRWGMRARPGAIQKIEIKDDYEVEVSVIGDTPPHGICGSGLIDLVGELFLKGVIDRSGRIKEDLPTDRTRAGEEGREFVLVRAKDAEGDEDIVVTEVDLRNLIRSKAAVYAGASALLSRMNLRFEDIEKIFIGGAFGSYLDIEKSILFGLLPDLPRERFLFIGNSSLTGAKMSLLSYDALIRVDEIARKMTYIELSNDVTFMDEFTKALFLPHTDLDKFPRVARRLGRE